METIFGVFAKQPIPGRTKTRLAATIGAEAAAAISEAFLRDLTTRFAEMGDRRVIGFSPPDSAAEKYFRTLAAARYDLWAQPDTSLGERMTAFFQEHLTDQSSVVLIGSDSPSLPTKLIEMAFTALEADDCVIGPATDGGYYLIGFRRWATDVLDNVEWSGPGVLSQTVRNVTAADLTLQLLPPWYDVDTLNDLYALEGHLAALQAAGQAEVSQFTQAALQQWMHQRGAGD